MADYVDYTRYSHNNLMNIYNDFLTSVTNRPKIIIMIIIIKQTFMYQ